MFMDEFIRTVSDMLRAAQKRYFTEGRKQSDLIEAKRLEALVDKAIRDGVVFNIGDTTQDGVS